MITGAGGFIGSALCRFLDGVAGVQLILLDNGEHGLHSLHQQLERNHIMTVGSVRDERLMEAVFEEHRPHFIFHTAALKHVQLMETNPFAAADTNALGTQTIVAAAVRHGAEQFVLLSTDKAVDPIAIMGATKRFAEHVSLCHAGASGTQMKVLRLCNVLGSTGSVAPLFCEQISQGRPLTVTHPDATRYFLSIDRTVQCLLAAAAPDCRSGLYVPVLGPPYRIFDLAQFLIEGAPPSARPRLIEQTALRVGDKLHEQMVSSREVLLVREEGDSFDRCLAKVETMLVSSDRMQDHVKHLAQAVETRDARMLLKAIERCVPEYIPSRVMLDSLAAVNRKTP